MPQKIRNKMPREMTEFEMKKHQGARKYTHKLAAKAQLFKTMELVAEEPKSSKTTTSETQKKITKHKITLNEEYQPPTPKHQPVDKKSGRNVDGDKLESNKVKQHWKDNFKVAAPCNIFGPFEAKADEDKQVAAPCNIFGPFEADKPVKFTLKPRKTTLKCRAVRVPPARGSRHFERSVKSDLHEYSMEKYQSKDDLLAEEFYYMGFDDSCNIYDYDNNNHSTTTLHDSHLLKKAVKSWRSAENLAMAREDGRSMEQYYYSSKGHEHFLEEAMVAILSECEDEDEFVILAEENEDGDWCIAF